MFFKIDVLKNFTILAGKHLCQSLFNKVLGLQSCDFVKKRLQHRCFPVNIMEFLRTSFFIEHLWWLLLNFLQNLLIISQQGFSQKFLRSHFLVQLQPYHRLVSYRFFSVFVFPETYQRGTQNPLKHQDGLFVKIVNSTGDIFGRKLSI